MSDLSDRWMLRDREDPTQPRSAAAEALPRAWRWVVYVKGHEFAAFLSRQKAEAAVSAVNASSPLRDKLRGLVEEMVAAASKDSSACHHCGQGPMRAKMKLAADRLAALIDEP